MTGVYGTEPRLVSGRYELGAVIGYGGMAEVYRGRDVRLGREVAVKTLRADLARDPTFLARFRREAQSSAALNHPAIVSVYDTGEDEINGSQIPFIVMEFVEGRTLRDVLQTEGRFTERRAMEITSDVCAALDYSHRMGIIHRDIKPANVMLCPDGSVKVMDFGIARATTATSSTMTATAAVIGTAQYLSPEQARGSRDIDARSDVYTTGVLLYELLTGQPPFRGDNPVAVAYQHVKEQPEPPSYVVPSLSPEADAVVFKAMEKNPDDRYLTAGEMRDDLERALAGRRIVAPFVGAAGAAATELNSVAGAGTQIVPQGRGFDDPYAEPYDETGRYEQPYGGGDRYGRYDDPYERTGPYSTSGGERYDAPYDRTDRYGGGRYDDTGGLDTREPERSGSSGLKYGLAALGVVVVFVVVALLATQLFGGNSGGGEEGTTATIPTDLVGRQAGVVRLALEQEGFTNIQQVPEPNAEQERDTVLKIDPTEGSEIDKGALITLTVAAEPGEVPIPDVLGQTQENAESLLAESGFEVDVVPFTEPTTRGAGQVERYDPSGAAPPGTVVTIHVVSPQVAIPQVVGLLAEDATAELRRWGFEVSQQETDSDEQVGKVVQQSPAGGSVDRGSRIVIYVSGGPAEPTQTPSPTQATTSPAPTSSPSTSATPSDTGVPTIGLPGLGGGSRR